MIFMAEGWLIMLQMVRVTSYLMGNRNHRVCESFSVNEIS